MTSAARSPWDLSGKQALVTGAGSGGLGHGIAVALGDAGADVAVMEHPDVAEQAEPTLAVLTARGRRTRALLADVTDETAVAHEVDRLAAEWDGIDILVTAAGVMLRRGSLDTGRQEWNRVIDVNVSGTWIVCNAVARHMVGRGGGRIVTMASQYASIVGPMPEAAYYASKGAVANLTRGLAAEWAPHGIAVNCLAPGTFYPTGMTRVLGEDEERLEWMRKRTLLGRLGDPARDLAGPAVFLASAASEYVTGTVLHVDGGWTAW